MTEKLLEKLAGDSLARLKWVVCRELGILPGSWGWRFMTARRILKYACHLVLDARERGGGDADAVREAGAAEGFDLERFYKLGGGL